MAMAPTNVASAPATLVAMVTTASATPQKLAVQNLTKNACEYLSYVFLQAKHFFVLFSGILTVHGPGYGEGVDVQVNIL